MPAIAQDTAQDFWSQHDEPAPPATAQVDPRREDAYWERSYWRESYYRPDFEYEDYAPAYCVGYIGFAQYGGSYADAEKSLCANWLRIKGGARLGLDDALLAMRAAWDHAAQGVHGTGDWQSGLQLGRGAANAQVFATA